MNGQGFRNKSGDNLGLNILNLAVIYCIILILLFLIVKNTGHHPFNLYISVLWSLYTPVAIIGILGTIKSRKMSSSEIEDKTEHKMYITIPTVATENVLPALRRVLDSIYNYTPEFFQNFSVDLVIDEGSSGEGKLRQFVAGKNNARIIVVPSDFQCQNGAIAKARALEYSVIYRRNLGETSADEFVYHLDDDTSVTRETISSLAGFINTRSDKYDLAQGILTFPHEFCKSGISRIADSVRPSDDLTRFFFFTGTLHIPLAGLHGEHLLVRANVEDSIGWDFGPTKVEDSAFGLEFAKQFGRRSYFLNSRVQGSSPQSLKDLIRQRRRWYSGIISLAFSRRNRSLSKIPLMIYALITMFSPLQYILVVFLISAIISTPAFPESFLFLPLWAINFSYQLWLYEEGYNINSESSSGKKVGRSWMRFLIMPLIYVSGSIEATAVALGFIDYLKKDNSFQVIEKPI